MVFNCCLVLSTKTTKKIKHIITLSVLLMATNTPHCVVLRSNNCGIEEKDWAYEEEEDNTPLVVDLPKTASQHRWQVLRILAGTRQKFRHLRDTGKLRNSD